MVPTGVGALTSVSRKSDGGPGKVVFGTEFNVQLEGERLIINLLILLNQRAI